MRIIFMGTPDYAAVILESLLRVYEVCALVCQEDKKAGRDMQIKIPPTKELLQIHAPEIPVFQPDHLDEEFAQTLSALHPDIIIVAAYGRILPKRILAIAPCVNLHASILPKFRGASPIQQSILQQESYFGVSVMQMEEGLDCGAILGFRIIKNVGQDSITLFDDLARVAATLTLEYLERRDRIFPLGQKDSDASYCKKIKKEFGLVEFVNAQMLETKALAYSGWPGIYLKSGMKLKKIKKNSLCGMYQKGEVLDITQEGILVGCLEGSVLVEVLQVPSKKAMMAYEYAQGRHLKVGDILE